MKKILIALDNEELISKIKKTGKYIVCDKAISYQEGVLFFLGENKPDIIVTKDTLEGDMTREIYLKQIRLIAPKAKIILFCKNLSEEYKGFLFANEIFNIIESDEIDFINLLDMLEESKEKIIYKNKELHISKNPELKVITKKLIAVFGTSGAGKTYVASVLGNIISKKVKLNTLIIDMDTLNSAIDIYNNVDSYDNSLMQVMEEIDNGDFGSSSLYNNVVKAKKNSKLNYLTNNASIYEAQNKMSPEYYKQIYAEATSKFDATIVDLPSTPFVDVVPFTVTRANDVFFVITPNFISIRQALKNLELMVDVWGVSRENIHIVVNKKKNSGLDRSQVEMLLRGYKVCMEIPDSNQVEEIVNGLKEIEIPNTQSVEYISSIFGDKTDKSVIINRWEKVLGINK